MLKELNVTLGVEELKSILFEPVIDDLEAKGMRVVETQITAYVGYVPAVRGFMRKSTGCGSVNYATVSPDKKTFTPVKMKGGTKLCAESLDDVYAQARNKGVRRAEITGTILETLLIDSTMDSLMSDIHTQAWLGNTGSTDPLYTPFDGIWEQAIADGAITAYTSGASGTAMTSGQSITMFSDLVSGVNTSSALKAQLRKGEGVTLHVSYSVYENYMEYLESIQGVEAAYRLLQDGTRALYWRGIPVIPHQIWDAYAADSDINFGSGVTTDFNLAMLVADGNLVTVMDTISPASMVEMWYDKKDELNYAKAAYLLTSGYVMSNLVAINY